MIIDYLMIVYSIINVYIDHVATFCDSQMGVYC